MAPARVCLAAIAGAHGVRGLVKLKAFTEDPTDVFAYGPLSDEAGRRLEVTPKSSGKGGLLAEIAGVTDRETAQALRGTRLYVPREALPAPAENEFYHADLIGLIAETEAGRRLGRVAAVFDFGAGDLLEIEGDDGPTVTVPFTEAAVPEIDLAGGRLVVDSAAVLGAESGS